LANTWIAVRPETDEELAEFRSSDLDIANLFDRFGLPIDVYDKTDGRRLLGSIIEESGPLYPGATVLRFAAAPGTLLRTEKP
jgi:hypothetical protein